MPLEKGNKGRIPLRLAGDAVHAWDDAHFRESQKVGDGEHVVQSLERHVVCFQRDDQTRT